MILASCRNSKKIYSIQNFNIFANFQFDLILENEVTSYEYIYIYIHNQKHFLK